MGQMTDAERLLRECVRLWQNALDTPGIKQADTFIFREDNEGEQEEAGIITRHKSKDTFKAHRHALQELQHAEYIQYTEPPGPLGEFVLTSSGKRFGLKLLGRKP